MYCHEIVISFYISSLFFVYGAVVVVEPVLGVSHESGMSVRTSFHLTMKQHKFI